MYTIVLVDDHSMVRQGLRLILESEPTLRVIGEADDGLQALTLVEQLQPDVVVLDLMMPGLSGLEVVRRLTQRQADRRIIVLSMYMNEAYVLEALRHGALGYVLKEASAAELVHAVHEVLARRRYLSPPLSERAIACYVAKAQAPPLDPYDTLTNREREVLQLVAESYSNLAIAERLSISPRTVETHRAHVLQKLGLRTSTDLIRYALQRGLIPLHP